MSRKLSESQKEAIEFFNIRLLSAKREIERCELQILSSRGDFDAVQVLRLVQAKYEALVDELENSIQRLK
jgi:hypothetical protein